MKYRKATRLDDLLGYYDPEKDLIVVDFSKSLLTILLTSYHEIFHKLASMLMVQDWLDILAPLLRPSSYKSRSYAWAYFKAIFQKAEVMPLYDDQKESARVETKDVSVALAIIAADIHEIREWFETEVFRQGLRVKK